MKKDKKNKTSSSTCGQQCIMQCQEHNRSKKATLREKRKDPTSMTVPPEKTVIVDKLLRKEFLSPLRF